MINRETITEHCKRHAAQVIHDTMECETPRNEHDWSAACRIIGECPGIVDVAMRLIAEHCGSVNRDADPNHYGAFKFACHRLIWENLQGPRARMAGKKPYGNITFG